MATNICTEESVYNKFEAVDDATEKIVDYLFTNSPNLWKLLYYTDRQPLFHDDLTTTQKAAMICKDPTIENAVTTKNILFQTYTSEALSITIPQVRIELGNIPSINSYQGYVEINFQIVVPHNLKIIITDYSSVADRSVAIYRELVKALNGVKITDAKFKSPMFINKSAPDGTGRNTGAYRESQNKNYAGYWATFSALI